METTTTITPAIARTVLGFYHLPGGWAVGGFELGLLTAFTRADSQNFERLAQSFPGHAMALRAELQELKDIAEGGEA